MWPASSCGNPALVLIDRPLADAGVFIDRHRGEIQCGRSRRNTDAGSALALAHGRWILIKLSARYGIEALVNREAKRRTMRGFKIATAKLATPVRDALRLAAVRVKRSGSRGLVESLSDGWARPTLPKSGTAAAVTSLPR
jgi:hypothetical protein